MTDPWGHGGPDSVHSTGHTVEDLSDYFDRGRVPADASIDSSPECGRVLGALAGLRALARELVADDVRRAAADDAWVDRTTAAVATEAGAGDVVAQDPDDSGAVAGVTEADLRNLVRTVGDATGEALVGRCEFDGDPTVPGTPVTVRVRAAAFWGQSLPGVGERIRAAVTEALASVTGVTIAAVDVVIEDVLAPASQDADEERGIGPAGESRTS